MSPESLRVSARTIAGADNAPAIDAPVLASALHLRKSLRATPLSSLCALGFGWVDLFHNGSRKFWILRRRRLLLAFISNSLGMLDWGLWFERQPNSSTRVTAGLAVNGGPETLGQMIPAEGEGRFLRPGFCRGNPEQEGNYTPGERTIF
jgi:hypothetical protein